MKVILLGLVLTLSGCGFLSAQTSDPTPELVLESGRLLIDLIQTFKPKQPPLGKPGTIGSFKDRSANCPEGINQICFENASEQAIQVAVFTRPATDSTRSELFIPPKQSACSYFYRSGIFIFEVQASIATDSIAFLERGELLVGKCEQVARVVNGH
ncbi:MAG: hypothetical protein AAF598_21620 [Bacteroidota bacterium]